MAVVVAEAAPRTSVLPAASQYVPGEVSMSALSGYPADGEATEAFQPAAATRIRVMVVDDQELIAESLAAALGDQSGIEVAAVASTVAQALELADRCRPEVVIVDERVGGAEGVEVARRIRQTASPPTVVFLSAVGTEEVLRRAVAAGCLGAVTKNVTVGKLSSVIRAVARGEKAVAGDFASDIRLLRPKSRPRSVLTAREEEILQAIGDGATTSAIARSLGLSEYTVRNHVRNILAKLDAHTKLEAVVQAAKTGIISLHEE